MIPFLKPTLPGADSIGRYLKEMDESRLYSNFGPLVQILETRLLESLFGGEGTITTVHNATLGLMLAIDTMRRPSGRYALMPSFTFAATPLAAMWAGLTPYFIDIDEDTWLLSGKGLDDAIASLGSDIAIVVPYASFRSRLPSAHMSAFTTRGFLSSSMRRHHSGRSMTVGNMVRASPVPLSSASMRRSPWALEREASCTAAPTLL